MREIISNLFKKWACCHEWEQKTRITVVDPAVVSEEDIKILEELSFIPDDESFISYRFGSC